MAVEVRLLCNHGYDRKRHTFLSYGVEWAIVLFQALAMVKVYLYDKSAASVLPRYRE